VKLLQVIAIFVAIYIAAFLTFVALLPTEPNAPLKADAIVALTGGDSRLGTAVSLFEGGTGKRLLITGVNKTLSKDDLRRLAHGGRRFDCCADVGYAAEDTYGNAEEAADWAAAHRYRSLIVVTASYHMPRSIRLFRSLMPRVKLIQYPVEPEGVHRAAWWHPGMLHLLHNEFLKYLASFVMTAVDHHSADGKSPLTS
jgi:uncharacterized SAM-binding protein YcdF (DUF218 family)